MKRDEINVAVICEHTGTVRDSFRTLGFNAYSFDIKPDDYDSPYHVQGDALIFNFHGFHLAICHPPCTDIAISGAKHFEKKGSGRILSGVRFALRLWDLPVPFIGLENPRSMLSLWMKPDQVIQPYWFGHEAQKTTCLWLKNLPPLTPTEMVGRGRMYVSPQGKVIPEWIALAKIKDRGATRSVTFDGIAWAMATQWGSYIETRIEL